MTNTSSLVFFVTLLLGCSYVSSCQVTVKGQSPIFTKDFGSKIIVFKVHENKLILEEGETVKAYCREITITLRSPIHYYDWNGNGDNAIERHTTPSVDNMEVLSCESNSLKFSGEFYAYAEISCPTTPRLSLYESNKNLPKCTNFMNYAFGFKLQDVGDVIKSGICYDLEHLQLKFASYVAYEKEVLFYNETHVGTELALNLKHKLDDFNKYFEFINQESKIAVQPPKLPFRTNEFYFDSLLQDEPLKTQLHDFKYIFNIMWWRQLREENWRFFLDALTERSQTTRYVIHVGTFGNITIPTAHGNCTSNDVVSMGNEDMLIKAPGYIWAYLKSITPGVEEEFVVIGHNSPYKQDPDHSEFCKVDVCDDVEWLKNSQFGHLRHLPTLGYTFCCIPEEVAAQIDYFPFETTEI